MEVGNYPHLRKVRWLTTVHSVLLFLTCDLVNYFLSLLQKEAKVVFISLSFDSGIHAQGKEKPTILESPWMFGDPIYKSTGLCLSFSYLLSTKSESSLTVFVLTSSNSSIWRLNGFHGDSWHTAQVQFTINGNFMVTTYFECGVSFNSIFLFN